MSDPAEALWNAIHCGAPVVVVLYADLGLAEAAVAEVDSLGDPAWSSRRVSSVAEALTRHANELVLLVPTNEAESIADLEGGRDLFVDRVAPVVLFLVRGGDGERALREAPSLASWIRGSIVDPEELSRIDAVAEREKFLRQTAMTPEAWLEAHGGGELISTEDLGRTYRARLLER